jgi:hypothetical protein
VVSILARLVAVIARTTALAAAELLVLEIGLVLASDVEVVVKVAETERSHRIRRLEDGRSAAMTTAAVEGSCAVV